MVGQGSPNQECRLYGRCPRSRAVAVRVVRVLWLAFLFVVLSASSLRADGEIDLKLRVAWGGGARRQWQATIQLVPGQISAVRRLALEPDTPGSTTRQGGELRLTQRSPRVYDGADIHLTGPPTARLLVSVRPVGQEGGGYTEGITLSHLVAGNHTSKLDERGNSVLIQRAPGDRIRVHFERPSLIFSTAEEFTFSVDPHLIEVAAGAKVACEMTLVRARTDDEVWSRTESLQIAADGRIPSPPEVDMVMPTEEGVYDLVIRLTTKKLTTVFRPVELARRNIQLVVLAPKPPPPVVAEWEEQLSIDPSKEDWWERLIAPAGWSLLPWASKRPPSHGEVTKHKRRDRFGEQTVTRLGADAWTAYPLPIENPGRPHVLEVDYPADIQQTLGISIVEPDASGSVLPIGIDSGVDIPEGSGFSSNGTHRLIFWPKTATPWVLLTNRSRDKTAEYGKIRVLAGPARLPTSKVAGLVGEGRLLSLFYDKPLFPENFSATKRLDPLTNRSLDDWVTFYDGATRLIQYMKHVGYNAVMIPALCEGSTIYPSKLLEATPKYDSGVFFATGQDARQKDVLELLFRLFDREGLKLIPSIHYSTPLPSLEEELRSAGADNRSIQLVNFEGKRWLAKRGTRHGLAPYYNPLNEQVQKAMAEVAAELAERYAHHSSFAGLSLQLGKDTYAQLPTGDWGYDSETIRQFAIESKEVGSSDFPSGLDDQIAFLYGAGREAWMKWRAEKLVTLHRRLRNEIATRNLTAKLYLNTADVFASRHARRMLQPTFQERGRADQLLLEIGIKPEHYRNDPSIILPRPQRYAPLLSLWSQQVNLRLRDSFDVDHLFAGCGGNLMYHESQPLRLQSFDEKSPFGREKTHTWLEAHLVPHGQFNRRRFARAMAAGDVSTIMDGGWLISLGQEDAIQNFVETYRRLPNREFRDVKAAEPSDAKHGVVVRCLNARDQTFVYFVNNAPWPARVHLRLSVPRGCRVQSLGSEPLPHLRGGGGSEYWTVELRPYDLLGGVLSSGNVEVEDWSAEIPRNVTTELRARLHDVRRLAGALEKPPLLDVLTNPSFDVPNQRTRIPGWVHAWGRALEVTTDNTQNHDGGRSLRVTNADSRRVAWVRSDPFAPPATGRISVQVWLRIEDESRQPTLRLAIEGMLDGHPYYRYASVGAGEQVPKHKPAAEGAKSPSRVNVPELKTTWEKYLFHVNDLPIGLTDLRVGFDLMDKGRVWIDDVELFDRWFREDEQDKLVLQMQIAKYQLSEQGETLECQQFLDSYWPQFLRCHVPLNNAEQQVDNPTRTANRQADPPTRSSRSVLDRMRGLVPIKVFPF